MKTVKSILLLSLLMIIFLNVLAQKNVSTLHSYFDKSPNSIQLSTKNLENLLALTLGTKSIITLDKNFSQEGIVIANQMKYENLQSVLIKFGALDNTLLQLSKIRLADNSFKYVGRIINNNATDGYELKKENENNYAFKKIEMKNVLQDCSY
jgi:hypothetical protein